MLTIVRLGRRADVLFVNGLALEAVLANVVLRKPLVQKIVGDVAWERATNWGWVQESFEEFQKQRYGVKVEVLKALRAWCSSQADRVIVSSHYLAGHVHEWGVRPDKIAVIYNAIALPFPSMGEDQGGGESQAPTSVSPPLSTPVTPSPSAGSCHGSRWIRCCRPSPVSMASAWSSLAMGQSTER
jgi:hypothetical protein